MRRLRRLVDDCRRSGGDCLRALLLRKALLASLLVARTTGRVQEILKTHCGRLLLFGFSFSVNANRPWAVPAIVSAHGLIPPRLAKGLIRPKEQPIATSPSTAPTSPFSVTFNRLKFVVVAISGRKGDHLARIFKFSFPAILYRSVTSRPCQFWGQQRG